MDRLSYDTQSCVQLSLLSGLRRLFRYWPIERPFYKFDGIDCCPKLNAKLVRRLFHRWWQVAPPVNSVTHGFFGRCYHLINGNIAVGLSHSLASLLSPRTKRFEGGSHIGYQQGGLFPGCEVRAFGMIAVVDKLYIGFLRPALRRLVNLFPKCTHADRKLDASHIEEAACRQIMPRIPIETRRGDRGVRQPIKRDVVEYIVAR